MGNIYNNISNEERRMIINMYDNGDTVTTIAHHLQRPRSTVVSIVHKILQTKSIEKQLRGGIRKKKLSDVQRYSICRWVDTNCCITLEKLKRKLFKKFNVKCCTKTVERALKDFHYTLKRTSIYPEKRNNNETIIKRERYVYEYRNILLKYKHEQIFFIDEAGFSLSMRNRRGRAPKGHRAITTVPSIRSRNISVCAAINLNGVKNFQIETTAYNSLKFSEFVKEFCTKLKMNGISQAVLVMDNVPFHKTKDVELVVTGLRDISIKILYLPPYSPFLNPVEQVFSKWKNLVRRKNPTNEKKLLKCIRRSFRKITNQNCEKFYYHMIKIMQLCVEKKPILDE